MRLLTIVFMLLMLSGFAGGQQPVPAPPRGNILALTGMSIRVMCVACVAEAVLVCWVLADESAGCADE